VRRLAENEAFSHCSLQHYSKAQRRVLTSADECKWQDLQRQTQRHYYNCPESIWPYFPNVRAVFANDSGLRKGGKLHSQLCVLLQFHCTRL